MTNDQGLQITIGKPKLPHSDDVPEVVKVTVMLELEVEIDVSDYDKPWHDDLISWAIGGNIRELINGLPACIKHVRTFIVAKP